MEARRDGRVAAVSDRMDRLAVMWGQVEGCVRRWLHGLPPGAREDAVADVRLLYLERLCSPDPVRAAFGLARAMCNGVARRYLRRARRLECRDGLTLDELPKQERRVGGRAMRTTLGSGKRDRWVRATGTTRVRPSGTT